MDSIIAIRLAAGLLFVAVVLLPFYEIYRKAGFSGWLCLLNIIPIVNIVVLYYIAFAQWPALKENKKLREEAEYR